MLSGQELSMANPSSLVAIGLAEIALELAILLTLIVMLSKIIRMLGEGAGAPAAACPPIAQTQLLPNLSECDEDEELAAVIAAVHKYHEDQTGEEIVIKSIRILN